jgi:hypothetical protein
MKSINWTYVAVKTVVMMFMIGAATISFGHIVETSHELGLTWESFTVPFFVDGLAILGLIGRTSAFARPTNRAGWVLILTAGSASLAANIYAGHNLGQQLYGALVVVGFGLAEWYATKLQAAPAPAPEVDEATRVRRSAAAVKAAQTRAKNKARAARRPKAPAAAPVSPATVAEIDSVMAE